MPNTKSAKKAYRASLRKRQQNNFWRNKVSKAIKDLELNIKTDKADTDILNKKLSVLQKALDKAAKNSVIHKNKANRLKSRYANRITALNKPTKTKSTKTSAKGKESAAKGSSKKGAPNTGSKSKS